MFRSPVLSRVLALAILPAALLAAACSEDPVEVVLPPEARIDTTTFAPSLAINLAEFSTKASGLYVKELQVGTGAAEAATGDTVHVHYQGWFPNGTMFESTSPDFPPASFVLGQTIQGWNEGLAGMRAGGARTLIIPPSLGYGYEGSRNPSTGQLSIPGNQVLIFTVYLIDVKKAAAAGTGTT